MKKSDVPGNSMASAVAVQRQLLAVAERLVRFEKVADRLYEEDCLLLAVRIICPGEERTDYLAVVSAWKDGVRVVGFHNAEDFSQVVSGVVSRLENGSLKWKEDQYAKS